MTSIDDVVWPRSARGVQARRPAPRLDTLDGARIAFLWDYLFRGDELFPVLERALRERFPSCDIVGYDVFGNLHGVDEKERWGRSRFVPRPPVHDRMLRGEG